MSSGKCKQNVNNVILICTMSSFNDKSRLLVKNEKNVVFKWKNVVLKWKNVVIKGNNVVIKRNNVVLT